MSPRPVNIEIAGTDLPERLVELREQRQLTKSELATLAKVSYRTVHELESSRRERIQEKTLLLLAEALGVPPSELYAHCTEKTNAHALEHGVTGRSSPITGRKGAGLLAWLPAWILLLTVLTFGAMIWVAGSASAKWAIVDGKLEARHAILGHELWRYSGPGSVEHVEVSPWSNGVLLVLTREANATASPLLALDRRNGRVLWSATPDLDQLAMAFGQEIMEAGSMYPCDMVVADLRGDGEAVLVVNFRQTIYYPTSLCVIDRHGRVCAQYNSKGYIYDMLVADIDGTGKDVVVAAGTNNDPVYQGASIIMLDDGHFRGATIDALTIPTSALPDSARYRLVLPSYPEPYMRLIGLNRLNATQPQLLRLADGSIGFNVIVGSFGQARLIILLDTQLRPLRAAPADAFLGLMERVFPDSLQGTGPADPDWVMEWLDSHVRFEAGHWPPPDLLPGTAVATD